jgi:hypothetical protein
MTHVVDGPRSGTWVLFTMHFMVESTHVGERPPRALPSNAEPCP